MRNQDTNFMLNIFVQSDISHTKAHYFFLEYDWKKIIFITHNHMSSLIVIRLAEEWNE